MTPFHGTPPPQNDSSLAYYSLYPPSDPQLHLNGQLSNPLQCRYLIKQSSSNHGRRSPAPGSASRLHLQHHTHHREDIDESGEACHIGPLELNKKGTLFIEIILWLLFIIPGLMYSIWRRTGRWFACKECGTHHIVPLSSPLGRDVLAKKHQSTA